LNPAVSAEKQGSSRIARVAATVALIAGVVLIVVVLLGSGGGGHTYHLLFENAGQLVKGNQVLVAGQPVGTIDDVGLTDNSQADITVTTDDPLREGTAAVIRDTSLSGVANRYISLTPGPNNSPNLPNGATLQGDRTTSPVDLDQLFNTFTPRTRRALQKVIQGQATYYAGNTHAANQTFKYFAPSLDATQRLFAELTRDQSTFTKFLISSGRVLTVIGDKGDELSSLIGNANTALTSIASQNDALDRSLVALPPALRQSNTTFVNLRAALDDLTPLVAASKPATKRLPEFLSQLRVFTQRAVPVVGDLAPALNLAGPHNDLTDALQSLPLVAKRAASASPRAVDALNAGQPQVTFARPYAPELAAFVSKLDQATAYYDANGHYARADPADTGVFSYNSATHVLSPQSTSQQFSGLETGIFTRCPGGATQALPGSNPFLDDGALIGECDPSDVPPGP
jgi:phospholipid/cholesterol/gamma-HCH transport system substrate-binding protein